MSQDIEAEFTRDHEDKKPANAGLMLTHRRIRWANIKPALRQRFVFVGQHRSSGFSASVMPLRYFKEWALTV